MKTMCYGMKEFARLALRDISFKGGLRIDIKEFTEPKHVAHKTKEACQGFCEWKKGVKNNATNTR